MEKAQRDRELNRQKVEEDNKKAIAAQIRQLVEMNRIKDDSWCCGAGSWLRHGYLETAQWTADQRIEEAKATGAEAVVTYCPHCEENLGEAIQRQGNGMKIYDLLDLVLKAL